MQGAADEDDEFERAARDQVARLRSVPMSERIAVACRGSANPAALAWIAEGTSIGDGMLVLDLGAGLGGPAAWLAMHYGCEIVGLEPARSAAEGVPSLFELPSVHGDVTTAPFRDRCADVALMLGVVSVVDDPIAALRECRRVGSRLGLLDYCATTGSAVEAGGSVFPSPSELSSWVEAAGWTVDAEVDIDLDSPPTWERAIDAHGSGADSDDEQEVVAVIERGAIVPRMLVAS